MNHCSFTRAAKVAKSMLSNDRGNLFLWSSYATLLASQKGKLGEARQVYVTCLSADRQPDDPYAVELFANWAEMEWLHGDDARCLAMTVVASGAASGGHVDLGKRQYSSVVFKPQ
jgi:hypothetical protein